MRRTSFFTGDVTNIFGRKKPRKSLKSRGDKRIRNWLLTGLVLVGVLWLVFILAGQVLTQIALSQIAGLTNTRIKTKSVDFNLDGSVSIKKLVIRPDKPSSYADEILKAETVFARFSKSSLLLLRPRLKEISVNDFVFDAQYDLDTDRWNISALKVKGAKDGSGKKPLVRLEKGTLQYSNVSKGQVEAIAAVPIDAGFRPVKETRDSYSFDITTGEREDFGKSVLKGTWQPGEVRIAGAISSTGIRVFERVFSLRGLAGELNYNRDNNYSLALRIDDLLGRAEPDEDTFTLDEIPLMKRLGGFAALQEFFNRYQPWGKLDIDVEATGNLKQLSKSKIEGRVHCKDISICNSQFPYRIEHLAGPIYFTENSISFESLHSQHKNVELAISGSFVDFGPDLKGNLQITSGNMALDKDLYDALNPVQKRLWSDFSPSGLTAIDYTLSRDSKTGQTYTLSVELLDVDGRYAEFPYPLEKVTGQLFFDQNSIDVRDFLSQVDERRITAQGRITATDTNEPQFDLLIEVNNVALDSTLASALTEPQRDLYSQFRFDGRGDGKIKVFSLPEDPRQATFAADLSFKDIFIKVQKLPIAISDISAQGVFTPDEIRIGNFIGRSWEGIVSLTGRIWPGAEAQQLSYDLSLSAKGAELNDNLISILPEGIKNLAAKVQPKGKVNFVADLKKAPEDERPDYEVVVECLKNSVGSSFVKKPSKEIPVDLEWFFYPLNNITGNLTITKDKISVADITATAADNLQIAPNTPTIKIDGEIAFADDAFSNGFFTICANDVLFNERLRVALPKDIQPFYLNLSPTGQFDLDFENIRIFNGTDGKRAVDLAGAIKLKNCSFDVPGKVTDLDAALRIERLYKTGSRLRDGRATLSTELLKIKDISLTGLNADILYVPSRRSWLSKSFIADCYGGKVTGKLEFTQPTYRPLEYLLQIGFENIDLKQFLSDIKPKETSGNDYTLGKVSGSLSVIQQTGEVAGHNYPRIGRCRLQITDMQVGKASLLAKLLSVLKLTEPQDCAFDRMFVDSYIEHNRVFFEQLDISGQAVAFSGSGWMDLQSQDVDLSLFVRTGRFATAEPSILGSLTEGLSQAVIRMDVTGNIYDPQVTTTTLPVLKGTLEIFGTKPNTSDEQE
jgi:hypothetical protein